MIHQEDRLREALADQELLAREMSHRLKNLFAMTDSMIRASARSAGNVEDMVGSLTGRLHALASAHSLVASRASLIGSKAVTDLAELITAVLKVHELAADGSNRISANGVSIPCGAHATNSIALVIYELATNATKYGALSLPNGQVDVVWRLEGQELVLKWMESGGPSVPSDPLQSGFRATLIARTVERQFGGELDCDWRTEGLHLTIRMDAAKLAN